MIAAHKLAAGKPQLHYCRLVLSYLFFFLSKVASLTRLLACARAFLASQPFFGKNRPDNSCDSSSTRGSRISLLVTERSSLSFPFFFSLSLFTRHTQRAPHDRADRLTKYLFSSGCTDLYVIPDREFVARSVGKSFTVSLSVREECTSRWCRAAAIASVVKPRATVKLACPLLLGCSSSIPEIPVDY